MKTNANDVNDIRKEAPSSFPAVSAVLLPFTSSSSLPFSMQNSAVAPITTPSSFLPPSSSSSLPHPPSLPLPFSSASSSAIPTFTSSTSSSTITNKQNREEEEELEMFDESEEMGRNQKIRKTAIDIPRKKNKRM